MPSHVTYGQLKQALAGLGFRERKQAQGVALEHKPSDTVFLFRPYKDTERLQAAELSFVRMQLDQRGLLEPEGFAELLESKAPA